MSEPFEIEVPDELYAFLKVQGAAEGLTADEFATKVIVEFLERVENESGTV